MAAMPAILKTEQRNRPFPSYFVLLFQNESSCKTEFDLNENEHAGGTHFNMNSLAQRLDRFDTEAKGNSEVAYSQRIESNAGDPKTRLQKKSTTT